MLITLDELSDFYLEQNRPTGIVVDKEVVLTQAIKATAYYLGFGDLANLDRGTTLDRNSPLTKSEVAVIMPLFELYVERENALILESSRSLGVEVYGRTISEISGDIQQKELEIQNLAFQFDFFTV